MIICGLIAAFIVVERFVYFRAIDKRDEKFKKESININTNDPATKRR